MTHQEFLMQLNRLEITDLLDAYIEAKTGKHSIAADVLPMETYEVVMDIPKHIKNYNAKVLSGGFSNE